MKKKTNSHTLLAEVAVTAPVHNTYTYSILADKKDKADDFLCKRVYVSFGKRKLTGYILGPAQKTEEGGKGFSIRQVNQVLDDAPLFPPSMIPFFRWIADYYIHPIGRVIQAALPKGLSPQEARTLAITEKGKNAVESDTFPDLDHKEKEVLRTLGISALTVKQLETRHGRAASKSIVKSLVEKGVAEISGTVKGGSTGHKTQRYVVFRKTYQDEPLSRVKKEIIDHLKTCEKAGVHQLKEVFPTINAHLKKLENDGYIGIIHQTVFRDPFGGEVEQDSPLTLTKEQADTLARIRSAFQKGFSPFLLNGVTGSGKTEVYLQAAAGVLETGKQVLVLVPEISLISGMESRFRARFGDRVAVLHSMLSQGERYDQWIRIMEKKACIVVGARSAVFAPLDNPGLIVVDEEHDLSYKQDRDLYYQARDLALVRGRMEGAVVILGSATPSVQSTYNGILKRYTPLFMTRRVEDRPLPGIIVVDLRKENDAPKPAAFISKPLFLGVKEALLRNEQVLIFLNRRGFSSFPLCTACGRPILCRDCDITLTFHRETGKYQCHYCGYAMDAVWGCPTCGKASVKHLGFGTERVETTFRSLFPEARIARMDKDTTCRKDSTFRILKALQKREIDILVGTQMVAKGHDFPHITLVGILCADLSLDFPDFRSSERTFQLLAQVSGRAGRGDAGGRVILQTYNPEHFIIQAARAQDYAGFYEMEIGYRKALDYPPFSRLIQLRVLAADREAGEKAAKTLGETARKLVLVDNSYEKVIQVLGPVPAPIPKIAGKNRWHLLIKGFQFSILHKFVRVLMTEHKKLLHHPDIHITCDVDPYFMM